MITSLRFRLVIDGVKTNNPLQENMELGMKCRVFGDLEERSKDV